FGSATATGGGIQNAGTLTLVDSLVSGNTVHATSLGGPPVAAGAGVYNTGSAAVLTSTVSDNRPAGISTPAVGERLTAAGATVTANAVGVVAGPGVSVTLRNTLIAGNTAFANPDVRGAIQSRGHNLIGDGTGGSGYDPTDLVGTPGAPIDPLLGPLQDNGG